MIKKVLVFLFMIVVGLEAYCCDCSGKPSIEENWKSADQVFTGKIIKVDSLLYGSYGGRVYSFTVKISKSYKDEIFSDKELRTILAVSSGQCDYFFNVGEEYLIYAKDNNYTLNCSICSRTDLLRNINPDELTLLGKLNQELKKDAYKFGLKEFRNNIQYQVALVNNSFEEKLKKRDWMICVLSALSFFLFVAIIFIVLRNKKNRIFFDSRL